MFIKNIKYWIVRVILAASLMLGNFGINWVQAESIDFGWAQRFGGGNYDYETTIALDDSGNVYTTGFMIRGTGNQDGFVHKWNSTGTYLWMYGVATLFDEKILDVALDGEGNVYVAGFFSDTVDFDGQGSVGTLTSVGLTDIFVLKLDGNLNFLWVKGVGGISIDGGYGITVDGTNVYVTGTYTDTVDFDPSEGVSNLTSAGNADVFILKMDNNGNFLWAKSVGGPATENSFDIAHDENGNIFITGSFSDTADFDPGTGTNSLTSSGEDDLFIDKLDAQGNFIWARTVGGFGADSGIEVTLDGSGNVYAVGYFNDTVSVGADTLVSAGSNDVLIAKLNNDGEFLWARGIGGTTLDSGYGIAVDENSNVYTTGEFSGTADFDPGAGINELISAGLSDIFISKLDSNGNFVWAKKLGGISTDIGEGVAIQNGNLFITGAFSDTVDFDLGEGISTLTSVAGLDAFVGKFALTSRIHYVKWDAEGANNGSSWSNAYTDLQSALAAASAGDEIWVAAGTYKPTTGTDRTVSFTLMNGVAIYGGFAGTEILREQRDPAMNVTILSGEIGAAGIADNSYHVVVGSGTNNTAVLDGFTITAGNANGTNFASAGAGMLNSISDPVIKNITFDSNSANYGGGMFNYISSPTLTDVTFQNNSASYEGGGMFNDGGASPSLTNMTFTKNSANSGGGMYNGDFSNPSLTNVTFNNNTAVLNGGGIFNYSSSPSLMHVTINNNSASGGGGIYNTGSSIPTVTNTIVWENIGGEIVNFNGGIPVISHSIIQGGYAGGTNILTTDPKLGPLADNGGFTQTMALLPGSPAIDAGDDGSCPATDQRGMARPQGNGCDVGAYELEDPNNLEIAIGDREPVGYNLLAGEVLHKNYPSVLAGPVKVVSTNGEPVFTTQVVRSGGSYNELAGYPVNQFDTEYWFPYYDHGYPSVAGSNMRTWILVGNPSTSQTAEVEIYIGGVLKVSYSLAPGANVTPRWIGEVGGPVRVVSTNGVAIFASERTFTVPYDSFNEMLGYPASQFTTEYWFPWYDTVYMDTYLLVGNTSGTQTAQVDIYVGTEKKGSYSLAPNTTLKQRYGNTLGGPVRVVSTNGVNIVASEYTLSGTQNSFNEVLGYPYDQFDTEYWFPWYDHGYPAVSGNTMRTWVLVGNPSTTQTANVEIYLDGLWQGSYSIAPGANVTPRWIGEVGGPVRVVSDIPVFTSQRVFTVPTDAFNEFMGIPVGQFATEYWFTWYDSIYMQTQLLIGKP